MIYLPWSLLSEQLIKHVQRHELVIQKKMIARYSVSTLVGLKKMGIFDHILKVEKQTLPDTLMERHVFNIDEKQCLIIIFKVKVSQSCPTLSDPMDCNLPGSSVHGILQARTLEWVAVSFSRESSQARDRTQVSRIAGGFFTIWNAQEACNHLINA